MSFTDYLSPVGGQQKKLGKENDHGILYSFGIFKEGDAMQYFLTLPVLDTIFLLHFCRVFHLYDSLCFVFLSYLTSYSHNGINYNHETLSGPTLI